MKIDRRGQMAEFINREGAVKNEVLMKTFGISIETLRRDLSYLEQQGLIEKVYGGAVRKTYLSAEPNYKNRETKNRAEKWAIAHAAETLIEQNEAVFFDLGTTVLFLAQQVAEEKAPVCFTNAIRTAVELSDKGFQVILPGGVVRAKELSVSGVMAYENMGEFQVDKVFIGVAGITADGIYDFIPEEAKLRKRVIDRARKVIALADFSKFGTQAMCRVCDVTEIDILITDEKAPAHILKELEKQGIQIIIAKGL